MNRSLGSLANLAKILEEAADPNSELREDRKDVKTKTPAKKAEGSRKVKPIDPKKKAWHDRRLREQAQRPVSAAVTPMAPETTLAPALARTTASKMGGNLMAVLATANQAASKGGDSKRPEAWRRKPGDPIF